MSEKIEINTFITKHENKCKGCRFEMIDVEDPLWEYGYPLKRVLIDNQTGETYDGVSELVVLLNEQQATIQSLKEENEQLRQFINKNRRLSVKELMNNANENELLKKKIRELEEENEQLKKQLENYRKSRDKWRTKAQKVDYWKHKSLELYKLLRSINLSDKEWEQFLNIINESDFYGCL